MIRAVLLTSLLLSGAAFAQVSVNSGALDQLKPTAPAAHPAPARPAVRPGAARSAQAHPAPGHPAPARPHTANLRPGPPPAVPATPPPAVALPPPVMAPVRPAPPPTPVPLVPTASGDVSPIKGGIRITFGAGGADLSPATDAAIRAFAGTVKADAGTDLNLYAFAAGVPDDPSTPRRLSLSRALAVRAVLIAQGIASTRIYPRALGTSASPAGGEGPPDRVDLMVATPPSTTP